MPKQRDQCCLRNSRRTSRLKAMPQCWSFNKNTKLFPVVSTPGNPLSEFEESFHFNRKKEWAIAGTKSGKSILCILCAASKLPLRALKTGRALLLHFFTEGCEKDSSTGHRKMSQGISTAITSGIWGTFSPFRKKTT